jgi:hypothetical protein
MLTSWRYIDLVALEAGCQQQPVAPKTVGLNGTVFSRTVIGIVDPTESKDASAGGPQMPTTTVAIIVVVCVVFILLLSGCMFIQYRKRRNRKAGIAGGRRRVSSLSFRCQTHLTPRVANFSQGPDMSPIEEEEKQRYSPELPSASPTKTSSLWNPHNAMASYQSSSPPPSRSPPLPQQQMSFKTGLTKDSLPLRSITTSLPMMPPHAHHSPQQTRIMSPADDFTTPTSTTSARSNAPLLSYKTYNPADYGMASPAIGGIPQTFSPTQPYTSPTSGTTLSPLLSQGAWPLANNAVSAETSVWEAQKLSQIPRNESPRPTPPPKGPYNVGVARVESTRIQTSFPGPPGAKR